MMEKSELKIFAYGSLLFGTLAFLWVRKELALLRENQNILSEKVSMGVRG